MPTARFGFSYRNILFSNSFVNESLLRLCSYSKNVAVFLDYDDFKNLRIRNLVSSSYVVCNHKCTFITKLHQRVIIDMKNCAQTQGKIYKHRRVRPYRSRVQTSLPVMSSASATKDEERAERMGETHGEFGCRRANSPNVALTTSHTL